ncbi:MAG: glutathione S-transferase [Pelagibacterium sp. SCN 64-44]|nr:MAG: glutathione S-transferase [Pelagibacterium sp. SCN 64-44]
MKPIISVFKWSPDGGTGMARDMPVRWALEEVGQPYEVRLVSFREMKEPAHLARQPFGQIPVFEQDGLVLFESGSIVLHIARRHGGLLPDEPDAEARAITWMFAALNTLEPPIFEREQAGLIDPGRPWHSEARLAFLDDGIRVRLRQLSARLGKRDCLEEAFTAGDLMVASTLRRVEARLIAEFPNLAAYLARAEARPAFQRAYAVQAAIYSGAPTDSWPG